MLKNIWAMSVIIVLKTMISTVTVSDRIPRMSETGSSMRCHLINLINTHNSGQPEFFFLDF